MSNSTTFTPAQTIIRSAWLNDVNSAVYDTLNFGSPHNQNWLPNSTFLYGNAGWNTFPAGINIGSTASSTYIAYSGTSTSVQTLSSNSISVGSLNAAGDSVTLSGWIFNVTSSGTASIYVTYYNSSNTSLGNFCQSNLASGIGWTYLSASSIVPANAAYCVVTLQWQGLGTGSNIAFSLLKLESQAYPTLWSDEASANIVKYLSGSFSGIIGYTSNYTVSSQQLGSAVHCNATAQYTLTLPAPNSPNFGGAIWYQNQTQFNQAIYTPSGNFYGYPYSGAETNTILLPPTSSVLMYCDSTNWVVMPMSGYIGQNPPQFDNSMLQPSTSWIKENGIVLNNELLFNSSATLLTSQSGYAIIATTPNIIFTMPAASAEPAYSISYLIKNETSGVVTITAQSGNYLSGTFNPNLPAGASVLLFNDGGTTWVAFAATSGLRGNYAGRATIGSSVQLAYNNAGTTFQFNAPGYTATLPPSSQSGLAYSFYNDTPGVAYITCVSGNFIWAPGYGYTNNAGVSTVTLSSGARITFVDVGDGEYDITSWSQVPRSLMNSSTFSSSTTLNIQQVGQIVYYVNGTGNATFTLPSANILSNGQYVVTLSNQSSYELTIVPPSGDGLDLNPNILYPGQACTVVNDGGTTWHHISNEAGTGSQYQASKFYATQIDGYHFTGSAGYYYMDGINAAIRTPVGGSLYVQDINQNNVEIISNGLTSSGDIYLQGAYKGINWTDSNVSIYEDSSGNGPGDLVVRTGTGTTNNYNIFTTNGGLVLPGQTVNVGGGQISIANGTASNHAINLGQLNASTFNGATLYNVTSSRALNTTYTNSTGSPMMVYVVVNENPGGGFINLIGEINGVAVYQVNLYGGSTTINGTISLFVPPGMTYYANANYATLQAWVEIY